MATATENPRFVLGLKLRNLRHELGLPLKEIAARSGLSISYLSEIEKGKKYPKPEKLLDLAAALEVPYDDLVSLKLGDELDELRAMFSSPLIHEFPFELFGIEPEDLFGLVRGEPEKAGALVRALVEIGRMYDVHVEQFLFAALRSYQQMNLNYFEDLEEQAADYRRLRGWPVDEPPGLDSLRQVLEESYGYRVDEAMLADHPVLNGLRSVYVAARPPLLLVNGRLLPSQKSFILGREIGYRHLDLRVRAVTSSWLQVESFEQLLNNFRASYFSGALLIDKAALSRDLGVFFDSESWDGEALLECMRRYRATPEMFFYRLTELVPKLFNLREIYFVRFSNRAGTDVYHLTKVLNTSHVPVPHGIGLREHYCRRWPGMRLLAELARRQREGAPQAPIVTAQRSRFFDEDAEFFVISMARPLALIEGTNSSVSLGFLINDPFCARVRFWDDPQIPRVVVNLTCERCGLSRDECHERAAPPEILEREREQASKRQALTRLMAELGQASSPE